MINRDNHFQNTKAIFKYKDSFINNNFFKWTKYDYKTTPQYKVKQMGIVDFAKMNGVSNEAML